MTQKQQLLQLFADNGGKITLGQILQTTLAAEYRARMSDLRREGYGIDCKTGTEPSKNEYRLVSVPLEEGKREYIKKSRVILEGSPVTHNQRIKEEAYLDSLEGSK